MSDKTGIEWTDATWNPVWGCTAVSPGCDHCYAETLVNGRLAHLHPGGFGTVRLRPEQLDKPLRWRRPRRIFVNSMSDLFHQDIPDDYIARVFAVMALAPQHTFQVLTKRHGRMRSLLNDLDFRARLNVEYWTLDPKRPAPEQPWPLRNVWLGVSVENQQWADIRIPALLDTPAAVRFLSCEPLLGPVALDSEWLVPNAQLCGYTGTTPEDHAALAAVLRAAARQIAPDSTFVDWVIVGGESGRDARPMHPDWARSLRDQCQAAGVPFHFKQWGEWAPAGYDNGTHLLQTTGQLITRESGTTENPYGHGSGIQDLVDRGHPGWMRVRRAGKKYAGRVLDGRTWDQYPTTSQETADA